MTPAKSTPQPFRSQRSGALSIREVRALPASVDLVTAGRALGIGRTIAYRMVRDGKFPIDVLELGKSRRCRKVDLLRQLGLPLDELDP